MQLSNLIRVLKEYRVFDLDNKEISGITQDSQKVDHGSLFVAITGHSLDGHNFVQDAIARGAVAVVTERRLDVNPHITQIVIPNTRKALSALSNRFFDQPSKKMKVVGVTGTNGKTTTTYMIKTIIESADIFNDPISFQNLPIKQPDGSAHTLIRRGQMTVLEDKPEDLPCVFDLDSQTERHNHTQVGLIGTVQYIIGETIIPAKETTPESVELQTLLARMAAQHIKYAVMEVSSQALVQHRTDDIDFHSAIFTNLTPEHLDYHHTFERYMVAKSRLFEGLCANSFAILNADDEASRYFFERTRANVIWYGIKNDADVKGKIINASSDSTVFILSCNKKEIEITLPLIGLHNVYNALGAITAGVVLGIDLETIKRGIGAYKNVSGRLEDIDCGQGFRVIIDYAHTAYALEAVLQSLRQLNGNRILLVFGCGGDRDRTKRPEMGRVAERLADRFWITNDNPRTEDPMGIIREIETGIRSKVSYKIQPDRRLAIKEAIFEAVDGNIVLIAGKGHETGQIFGNKVSPFNDREVAREILLQLRGN